MRYHDPLAPEPANPYKWVDGMHVENRSPTPPTESQAQAQPVEEPVPGPTNPEGPANQRPHSANPQLVRGHTPSLLDEQHLKAWEQKRRG